MEVRVLGAGRWAEGGAAEAATALGAREGGGAAAQGPTAADAGATGGQRPTAPEVGAPAEQRPTPALLRYWTAEMPLHSLAELAVTGNGLAGALNKRPGPALGERLQQLLLAAAAGDIPNDNQSLLQEAKRMDPNEP
ncbi:hypothetical protein AMQ83_28830 [Paenibacillus riograndensis]|nr:hypothetical protein AMQ83_28830 [Paenibacillus riograndensis]